MPRVTRRPLAEADILEIWDTIADDSLAAADRWVDRLDEQFRVLATQPLMGRGGLRRTLGHTMAGKAAIGEEQNASV